MKVVVSGATGWLGRASIAILLKSGIPKSNIQCFSSKTKTFEVDGLAFESRPFHLAPQMQSADCFIHLAFKTRDKVVSQPLEDYVSENRVLTDIAEMFIEKAKPKSVITISSGAVFDGPTFNTLASNMQSNPYGVLKLEEESRLARTCDAIGANLVINRLWGLSGRDIQNFAPYALAEFVSKSAANETIKIRSPHEVWRRYVDARELMTLCFKLATEGETALFDSGGPLVEIEALALKVVEVLGSASQVIREPIRADLAADRYYSRSSRYEELLAKHLQLEPSSLESQILETAQAIKMTEH